MAFEPPHLNRAFMTLRFPRLRIRRLSAQKLGVLLKQRLRGPECEVAPQTPERDRSHGSGSAASSSARAISRRSDSARLMMV